MLGYLSMNTACICEVFAYIFIPTSIYIQNCILVPYFIVTTDFKSLWIPFKKMYLSASKVLSEYLNVSYYINDFWMHIEYKIKLKILQLNCTNVVLNELWLFCKKKNHVFITWHVMNSHKSEMFSITYKSMSV